MHRHDNHPVDPTLHSARQASRSRCGRFRTLRPHGHLPSATAVCTFLTIATTAPLPARAELTAAGDVSPANLAAWTNFTTGYVGYTGSGTISIDGGSTLHAKDAYLAYQEGSQGIAALKGAGSSWEVTGSLYVGNGGSGALVIEDAGTVSVGSTAFVSYLPGSSGKIDFKGDPGTLFTKSLYASPPQVTGTGTISTGGIVTDGTLRFDATHGPSQTLYWNNGDDVVTVNFNLATPSSALGVGYAGIGSLEIVDGVSITNDSGSIGVKPGSMGSAVVDGPGSTWTNSWLIVGNAGTGYLAITNGGKVIGGICRIASQPGSTGLAILDGPSSTWNLSLGQSKQLFVGGSGKGTLAITNGGKLTSMFGTLGSAAGGSGVATIDGAGSTWTLSYEIFVGASGSGRLDVTNGGKISSGGMWIGKDANSIGTVILDGPTSTASLIDLWVSLEGNAFLAIINGAKLTSNGINSLGYSSGSTAEVSVMGAGSTWSAGRTTLGTSGTAKLAIANAGKVTAGTLTMGTQSLVTMSVGDGSLLTTGSLSNSGIIRLNGAASAVPGNTYTPITVANWLETGALQAFGGTWNDANHTFTVSQLATGNAGQPIHIDRSQIQRVHITNPNSGRQAIVNVLPSVSTANLSLTAAPLTPAQTALLQAAITPATSVLGGWTFDATGYSPTDPVYFSLSIGPGFKRNNLSLWRLGGNASSSFSPIDFSYDGTFASFTDTGFAGYAITLAAIHGDINLDGKVDAFDLNGLAAHWQQGSGAYWSDGDFNGDGKIDAFDLNLLAANWQAGTSLQLAPGGTSIPEPASLALLGLGALGLAIRRHRRANVA